MIHVITEGAPIHIGLNLYRSRGGFVALWAWYNAPARELTVRRARLRIHIRPWFLFSKQTGNVVDEYLRAYELVAVNREVLADTRAVEDSHFRRGDASALVNKQKEME